MDALILAGGKSSRMGGEHKGTLLVDGETITGHLIRELKPLAETLWLSYGEVVQKDFPDCHILMDEYKNCGPMGGLHAGLKASSSDILLVAACDMPLLKGEFYEYLLQFLPGHEGVVPVAEGKIHPLAAVYSKNLLPIFQHFLEDGNYRLRAALEQADICYVDVPQFENYLKNINTREEYEAFLAENN